MTRRLPLLICLLAFSACYSPTHVGEGEIRDVRLAMDLQSGFLHVTPGERHVVLETRGTPSGTVLVYDAKLLTEGTHHPGSLAVGVSRREPSLVNLVPGKVEFLGLPGFQNLGETPVPPGAMFDQATAIVPFPSGEGYAFVTNRRGRPNVFVLSTATRTFERSGRTAIEGSTRGHAMDDQTGKLLLTGDDNRLEIFDVEKMRTVTTVRLPVKETSWGLVAKKGLAFVGSTTGKIVPVDIAAARAGEPRGLGGPGDVTLALSESGRFLATAVQDRASRRPPYPTDLRVFYVDAGKLMEIARAFLRTRDDLVDLEILETTETVAISTTWDLLAWRYEKPE